MYIECILLHRKYTTGIHTLYIQYTYTHYKSAKKHSIVCFAIE